MDRKKYRTTFIGSESMFLEVINRYSDLHLIVCKKLRGRAKDFFGSSFNYGKKHGIQIIQPEDYFSNPIPTDVIIVSGYPKLIPQRIINHPQIRIINIHQSLLPAYRGRHPLNWAIINGEKYTGITIHHINKKFDAGNIIFQEKVAIEENDTIMDVYNKTVEVGKKLLKKTLRVVDKKEFKGYKQNEKISSYFPPRTPKDGKINWHESAVKIRNMVRALTYPYPGAYFYYKGKKLIVDKCEALENCLIEAKIGKPFFLDGTYIVKTGEDFLKIINVRNKKFAELIKENVDYEQTDKRE